MFTYARFLMDRRRIERIWNNGGRRRKRERKGKKGRWRKKKTREMCSFLASLMDSSISFTQQILTYTRDINVMMQDLCMRIDGGNFARIRTTRWSFNDALSIPRSIIAHFIFLPSTSKITTVICVYRIICIIICK